MTGQPVEDLEETLNRTLERHAEKAPAPAADLIERVETRYRGRRRARMTGAAATMALVLSGTAFGVWPDDGPDGTLGPADTATAPPSPPVKASGEQFKITPIEKLWPEAVHRIPAELPDGTEIEPQALIDGRTVLVNAWAGFEKASTLYAYDLTTGEATKITDVVTPKGTWLFASGFTVGDGRIIWQTTSDDRISTIWSVPAKGGIAVATVEGIPAASEKTVEGTPPSEEDGTTAVAGRPTPSGVGGLAVSDGKIYWSNSWGGVYTAPLSGGPAEPVPGTEKEQLVQWPWVDGPEQDRITGRRVRNLETGEKRTVDFSPGDEKWSCGITWCLGRSSATDRSGTETFRVPGHAAVAWSEMTALDRFIVRVSYSDRKTLLLLSDLKTRRSGSITLTPKVGELPHSPVRNPGSRMYSTRVAGEYVIVDLEAIG